MGFWDKIGFSGRNKVTDPDSSHNPMFESVGSTEASYMKMDDLMKIYHTIPHIKCVINAIAGMTANGVFKVINSSGDEVENHELVDLLTNPNFIQESKQFVFNYTVNKHVYGNAYLYKNQLSFSVDAIFAVPTEDVKIQYTGKLYDQTSMSGIIESITINQKPYSVEDIIILKENDDRLVVGESKILTLQQQISNIKHAYDARNVNITQRGATGILSIGGGGSGKDGLMTNPMSPKEKKAAEDKVTSSYGVGRGQNKTIVTTLTPTFTPMSFPTKDLQLFEEIEDDMRVIIDTYGLNDNLFSKIKGSTFNNVDATLKRVYQDTIIPNANIDAAQIGKQSGLLNAGERLIMDFSHLPFMREDEKMKAEVDKIELESLSRMFLDKAITASEYRANIPTNFILNDVVEEEEKEQIDDSAKALFDSSLKLRGTVGGVDGIISINQSVALGEMSRDVGINILVTIYQFSKEEAESLITDSKLPTPTPTPESSPINNL